MNQPTDWSAERMLALGRLHAQLEADQKLEPLMETLVAEPVYEFYPLRLRMSGGDPVRRYYTQFFSDFMTRIVGYQLLDEWFNERSVCQEYDISVRDAGVQETHRVVGILYADGTRLGGERIYGSRRVVELMAGSLFEELEPMD